MKKFTKTDKLLLVVGVALLAIGLVRSPRFNKVKTTDGQTPEPNATANAQVAEVNTKATNTGDYGSDYGMFDGHGTGATISYVHDRVVITSISVENAEVENPNKKAREILETVKKVIKEKGNKIVHVELITEKTCYGTTTIQQYVIIFEPIDSNPPPLQ